MGTNTRRGNPLLLSNWNENTARRGCTLLTVYKREPCDEEGACPASLCPNWNENTRRRGCTLLVASKWE